MQRLGGRLVYSAGDLNDYLECKRLTELSALVARGKLARPEVDDEQLELIRRKGDEHEQSFLAGMRQRHGEAVVCFERCKSEIAAYRAAEERTLQAMSSGAQVIYQATFFDGEFVGHADFLRRIDRPSRGLGDFDLDAARGVEERSLQGQISSSTTKRCAKSEPPWSWSYEVIDTKLALSPKPYFLIQLCNYSEHLQRLQGSSPEFGYVVLGSGSEERFRLHEYMAYYRHLKRAFLEFEAARADADVPSEYPFERKHCAICPWDDACTKQRRNDDHLSLVAWMRRDQIQKLEDAGIMRVTQLAKAADAPFGMNPATFEKLRRQAEMQVRGRESGASLYELLRAEPAAGFALLPKPASGDVFFDIEGDPLYEPGRGLEYLFGFWSPGEEPAYRAFWALNRTAEKETFEAVVDFLTERRKLYPAMHVYHYAEYEKSALRRLAQTYCTREEEVDALLRAEVFVDLYAVVRQGLVISEESYGLKYVERLYGFGRATEVKKGDQSIVMFERWMRDGDQRILDAIAAYNSDDCRSTYLLHQWLLERRAEAIELHGLELPFRTDGEKKEKKEAEQREEARRTRIERELMFGITAPQTEEEYREMQETKRMRFLLANLVAYHRREDKPVWWAYFDRCENVDQLFEFDKEAIARLELRDDIEPYKLGPRQNPIYSYAFPEQQHKMKKGGAHDPRTKKSGEIIEIDEERHLLRFKFGGTLEQARAITELIPGGPYQTEAQRASLARIGESFLDGNLQREFPAAFDLLAAHDPRTINSRHKLQPEQVSADSVSAVVQALDRSYLFIQGPPGSGKTTIGSRVICDLLSAGKRVAVMSTTHKAAQHLLHKVEECMAGRGKRFKGYYKHSNGEDAYESKLIDPFIVSENSNDVFENGDYDLAGGTSWLFARERLAGAFDYLFIDEAGQVALADALAVAPCAKNIVLLGDPSQLSQVSQGTHPLHAGESVLQHLLGDAQTVPEDRGIFLDVSYRMQPEICAFISDAMYDGRLHAFDATGMHRVSVAGNLEMGLRFVAVEHDGNSAHSEEEAARVVSEIARLREGTLVDSQPEERAGLERPVEDRDIIVVTPYNAQRRLIERKLHDAGFDVKVGTVDKFQGQEAAIVIYSMATSSGEDVPRDMEFLFERNRFNVAISRARALSILVCSPRLLDVACRTPEEMALANLLCEFVERASAGMCMV